MFWLTSSGYIGFTSCIKAKDWNIVKYQMAMTYGQITITGEIIGGPHDGREIKFKLEGAQAEGWIPDRLEWDCHKYRIVDYDKEARTAKFLY